MSQQKKIEEALNLLLSEQHEQAAELIHQVIVEKARSVYESLIDEEALEGDESMADLDEAVDEQEVGGDSTEDFTSEISGDQSDIEVDHEMDSDEEMEVDDSDSEESETEERLEDLESQLADLRAEFDALMQDELEEPNHADLAAELDHDDTPVMEKTSSSKLEIAPRAKMTAKGTKVAEETAFASKVGDTGQKGTAKAVGTGKGMQVGAEQTHSLFTKPTTKKDFGGAPVDFTKGSAEMPGKATVPAAKKMATPDNRNVKPKSVSMKADTTPKFTDGKAAGEGFTKSPLTKKPM